MASFGAHGRPSSYEATDLPGQGYNCCCKMVSVSVHLSATPGDLHPTEQGVTLWLHSLLHHDCHRTNISCVPKPGVGWRKGCDLNGFLLTLFTTGLLSELQIPLQCIFRAYDPSDIELSGFMFQLFGNLLAYTHPGLINALWLYDLYLTAKLLGKRHTDRLLLLTFRSGLLIGDVPGLKP